MTNYYQQSYETPSQTIANLSEAVSLLMQGAKLKGNSMIGGGEVLVPGPSQRLAERLLTVIDRLTEENWPPTAGAA